MELINLNDYNNQLESEIGDLFSSVDKEQKLDLESMVEFYYDKPVEFSKDILNFTASKHQKEILEAIRDCKRTAVKSGQGSW